METIARWCEGAERSAEWGACFKSGRCRSPGDCLAALRGRCIRRLVARINARCSGEVGTRLRAWTASHVPIAGLPAEVVRAMARSKAYARPRWSMENFLLVHAFGAHRSEAP